LFGYSVNPILARMKRFFVPAFLAVCALACAQEQDCTTAQGATVNGISVAASAAFTHGDGTIAVSVSNTLADPRSAAQLLNGVAFTLNTGQTTGTMGDNSAPIRKVQKGGTFVDLGIQPTGWALASNLNGGLGLCVLCTDLGAAGPSHLMIGPSASTGTYASANASIAGNKPHNPFTTDQATFILNVPGVTANTVITGVTFTFGTQAGQAAPGTCTAVGPILQ